MSGVHDKIRTLLGRSKACKQPAATGVEVPSSSMRRADRVIVWRCRCVATPAARAPDATPVDPVAPRSWSPRTSSSGAARLRCADAGFHADQATPYVDKPRFPLGPATAFLPILAESAC